MTEQRTGTLHARGFSLLEVLVSLCILTLCLSVIMSLYSSALRNAAEAAEITRATRMGESLLAQLGKEIPLRHGVSTGHLGDGYRWQMTVDDYRPDGEPQSWQTPLNAYWVELEIAWDGPDRPLSVNFTTLRLTTDTRTTP